MRRPGVRRSGPIAAVFALAAFACAPTPPPALPAAHVAAGPGVTIAAEPIPLNPQDPAQTSQGDFRYAGGLALTSPDTSRLHGMSDLWIGADGALVAIGDEGDLLQARIRLDPQGRLVGVTDGRLAVLKGLDGQPLQGKENSDSEGLAMMPDGDRLISFEEHDRIWRYPADGSPPKPAPMPEATFPFNGGMEGLAEDPYVAPDAYVVGGEDSGRTWTCRLSAACVEGFTVPLSDGFKLSAMTPLPDGRMAYVLRAWDPVRGSRITLAIYGANGPIDRLDLARPLSVDNFEGVAARPASDGSIRFYLISDDNFSSSQRTLLLAFDWSPKR